MASSSRSPDFIMLSDDETDTVELNQAVRSLSAENSVSAAVVGGATASIVNEKPLNIQSLFQTNSVMTASTSLASRPPTHQTNGKVLWTSGSTAMPSSSSALRTTTSYNANVKSTTISRQTCNNYNGNTQSIVAGTSHNSTVTYNPYMEVSNEKRPRFDPSVPIGNILNNLPYPNLEARVNRQMQIQANDVKQMQNFYVEAYDHKNNASGLDDEFSGQFRCTYNGCDKRLRNNIVFMYHLWAHVVRLNPSEDDDPSNMQIVLSQATRRGRLEENDSEPKSDLNRLRTCPECLVVQPNPYRMQLHYHRVHKRDGHFASKNLAACAICEAVIALEKMPAHVMGHSQHELPYHCRKCNKYRTSSRIALIEHFSSKHIGTPLTICPFCLLTFKVPAMERRRNVVTLKAYVEHMMAHDSERHQTCNKCALKHISDNRPNETFLLHYNQHTNPELRWKQHWKIVKKNLFSLKRHSSKPVCLAEANEMCLECSRIITKESAFNVMHGGAQGRDQKGGLQPRQHYTKELNKCAYCVYQTRCVYAMEMHDAISGCNPANEARWPFGRPPALINNGSEYLLKCGNCGFETTEGNRMAQHMSANVNSECRDSKVKLLDRKPVEFDALAADQKFELEVLGLRRLADIDPEVELQRKRAARATAAANAASKTLTAQERIEERRREIARELASLVSHYRVCELGANAVAIKHLLETDEGDDALDEAVSKTKSFITRRNASKLDCKFFRAKTEGD